MRGSRRGRVGHAGSSPAVGAEIISPASAQIDVNITIAAPHNHYVVDVDPHCCVRGWGFWRSGRAGGCPRIRARIISAAGVKISGAIASTPNDHFAVGPHCCVSSSRSRRVGGGRRYPIIRDWIVSAAAIEKYAAIVGVSAPDDHFAAYPHCRVPISASGRSGSAYGCPTVGAGVVPSASVQLRRKRVARPCYREGCKR